jgi:predicted DsbA family dithiol-disulfide isomerase
MAQRMGVPIRLPAVSPQPHTHLAWEGFQFAKEHGKGGEYNSRVLSAFFREGLDVGQVDVLTLLAGEVGLDEQAFRAALEGRRYREAHKQALRRARQAGVDAVPAFVIGGQVVSGLLDRLALEALIDEAARGG